VGIIVISRTTIKLAIDALEESIRSSESNLDKWGDTFRPMAEKCIERQRRAVEELKETIGDDTFPGI
jgi:uridine kinase